MKISSDLFKEAIGEGGLDEDKLTNILDNLNDEIQKETAKSYNKGLEKSKAEIESKLESDKSNLESKEEEFNSKIKELEAKVVEASNLDKIREFKNKVGKALTNEQIANLTEIVPADRLNQLDIEAFKRSEIEEIQDKKNKDKPIEQELTIEQMFDMVDKKRR